MRVLHVPPCFAPAFKYGGVPISTLSLCKALLRIGVNVEVFTTTANGASDLPPSLEGADIYEGVPVRYFPRAFPKRFFGAAGLAEAISEELDNCAATPVCVLPPAAAGVRLFKVQAAATTLQQMASLGLRRSRLGCHRLLGLLWVLLQTQASAS